jgi:coniferyl-aldehyde dehydrogenase
MRELLNRQRDAYCREMLPTRAQRVGRLLRLSRLVEANADTFAAAISDDFGTRSAQEVRITETVVLQSEIRHAVRQVGRWMKPRRVRVAVAYWPGRARLMIQPVGVVGIISPWNYPLLLALSPLACALAAGNRAMIKPSELTPRFSAALARAVRDTFDANEVTVIIGDAIVGKAFAALPFDHLVFTGSTAAGREVAQVAAGNLTPVTLELGGKSPAIIDASCDWEVVIERLAWGKLINAGQTCIAPDYVLVPRAHIERFVQAIQGSMRKLYPTFVGNPDYTSIVSDRHLARMRELVEDARGRGAVVVELESAGGGAGRQLAPVLLLNVTNDMRVMREEIFGPLLPVVAYDSLTDALAYVNKHERPLALYWFGTDRTNRERVLRETIAGGVSINDTLIHVAQNCLPFGGIGASGHGQYHGEFGFRQFSKQKPVFLQSRFSAGGFIRPPYRQSLERVLALLSRLI